MKKTFCFAVLVSGVAFADPTVEVSGTSWDDSINAVKVDYMVSGGPAVVTFSARTNGVAVSDVVVTRFTGDINRLVATGPHSFSWYPDAVWPRTTLSGGSLEVVLTAWATNAPPPFMVIDLEVSDGVRYYATKEAFPGGFGAKTYKTGQIVFRRIPAAGVTFNMGRTGDDATYENYYFKNTEAQHQVRFTKDFYLAVYETTQAQHMHVCAVRKKRYPGLGASVDAHPVESLSSYGTNYDPSKAVSSDNNGVVNVLRGTEYKWPADLHQVTATSVIGQFREKTGVQVDLPTESQWEYACRAGTDTVFYDGLACPTNIAWATYNASSAYSYAFEPSGTQEVGLLRPNAWDLYDMCGNVAEVCLDVYEASPVYSSVEVDPAGTTTWSQAAVLRGGSWASRADWYSRSASRWSLSNGYFYSATKYVGYRLCAPAEAVK